MDFWVKAGGVLLIILALFLTSTELNSPPELQELQGLLDKNYEEIMIVVEYLTDSMYTSIHIRDSSGKMFADLSYMAISNTEVEKAIEHLLESGEYIYFYKDGNTISITQWTGTQDIGCGIAYSIDGVNHPEVQFMTELVAMRQNGWFYYVDDYNAWRTGVRPAYKAADTIRRGMVLGPTMATAMEKENHPLSRGRGSCINV